MISVIKILNKGLNGNQHNKAIESNYLNLDDDHKIYIEKIKTDVKNYIEENPFTSDIADNPCLLFFKAYYHNGLLIDDKDLPYYLLVDNSFITYLKTNMNKSDLSKIMSTRYYKSQWQSSFSAVMIRIYKDSCSTYVKTSLSSKNLLYILLKFFLLQKFIPPIFKNIIQNVFSNQNNIIIDYNAIEKQEKLNLEFNETCSVTKKYNTLRNSAQKRNINFSLSKEDIQKLLSVKRCYYTGIRFNDSNFHRRRTIDRINNKQGYIPGNVVACTSRVNSLKSMILEDDQSLTLKQTLSFISKIEHRLKNDIK